MEVKLTLSWDNKDNYSAKVKTQTLDTCYVPVSIKLGLPPGMKGLFEIQYITATYSHETKGKECGQIVRWQTQDISGIHSAGKPFGVTVFVVVDGKVVGTDHKKFPRGKAK